MKFCCAERMIPWSLLRRIRGDPRTRCASRETVRTELKPGNIDSVVCRVCSLGLGQARCSAGWIPLRWSVGSCVGRGKAQSSHHQLDIAVLATGPLTACY